MTHMTLHEAVRLVVADRREGKEDELTDDRAALVELFDNVGYADVVGDDDDPVTVAYRRVLAARRAATRDSDRAADEVLAAVARERAE